MDLTCRFLCNIALYSLGSCFQSHPQLGVVFVLAQSLHSFWSYFSSSMLCTYRPGEFIFQCPIFLPFHTVHGILKARKLKWFAIPISSWLVQHRRGGCTSGEEIPHVQGKRNPSKTVGAERGHQRADRLKPQSQTTNQSDHTDHSLSNSMKLWAMPCRATQDGRVMVESSDRMWSMEKRMANHFSILASRTPWTVWNGKKIGHWKMNSPGQ